MTTDMTKLLEAAHMAANLDWGDHAQAVLDAWEELTELHQPVPTLNPDNPWEHLVHCGKASGSRWCSQLRCLCWCHSGASLGSIYPAGKAGR